MKESNNKPSDSQPIKPAYGASKETSSDNKDKKIVLSGIRSTGNLHLGNYFGALNKFVRMQDDCDCRFFIADLHALTTNPDPKQLHESVKEIIAEYLAAGLDPDKNILYVQSDVPEISEMYLLMNKIGRAHV